MRTGMLLRCEFADVTDRQANMDYCFNGALSKVAKDSSVLLMYDINCQYCVHLQERFRDSRYLHIPRGVRITYGIGLWHVHGHKRICFARHSPNFIHGAAQADGEIIETVWADLNEISGSTRTMTAANRKETLDDHLNDMNWKKLTRMGRSCAHGLSFLSKLTMLQ